MVKFRFNRLETKVLLSLAFIFTSNIALSADIAQTINPLTDAKKVMDNCAAIAKSIAALKPPAGHAEAVAAERNSATFAKEHEKAHSQKTPGREPPKIDPAHLKNYTPAQQAFLTAIRAQRKDLQKCGEAYSITHEKTLALAKTTGEAFKDPKMKPNEDNKKVAAALTAYMTSAQNLSAQIAALSQEHELRRYVNRTIQKYFLGQNVSIVE